MQQHENYNPSTLSVYTIFKQCATRRHFDQACYHPRNNEIISHGVWVGLIMYCNFYAYQKEQKDVCIKRFLKEIYLV